MNTECAYYDPYGPKLLKLVNVQFSTFLAKYLTHFLSRPAVFQKEMFSQTMDFLVSYIRPIVKSTSLNATKAKSYRPISVSHTIVVLIERLLCNSFFNTRTPYNFYGYVKERSCDIAVNTLKQVVKSTNNLDSIILTTLDANGALSRSSGIRFFLS